MARLRQSTASALIAVSVWAHLTWGADSTTATDRASLTYDRPVLILDPGMHINTINAIASDKNGRIVVTASSDKTVRIWDAATGKLEHVVHPPTGPNRVGEMYAVAVQQDGHLVAAGGWTEDPEGSSIYLIDPRQGTVVRRISGMPDATTRLAFSSDGRYLAAGTVGLRVFDRDKDWKEIAKDDTYHGEVYGLSFAADGRLATASDDGHVRLYDARFRLEKEYERGPGEQAMSAAFSPDGNVLAVTFKSPVSLTLLDGHTLNKLPDPNLRFRGFISALAWSRDGRTLFADIQAKVSLAGGNIMACDQFGRGAFHAFVVGVGSSVTSMVSLPAGGLAVAGGGPAYLGILNANASVRWQHRSPVADFQSSNPLGEVSADGMTVDFRFDPGPKMLRFSVSSLEIVEASPRVEASPPDARVVDVDSDGHATMKGRTLSIDRWETIESSAVPSANSQFAVGTNGGLYLFSADGELVWRRDVPSDVRSIRIADAGRLLVTALSDGTIRWFRTDSSAELLAFMPWAPNKHERDPTTTLEWVAWTPDGFYTSTPGAKRTLRWLVNRNTNNEAIAVPAFEIPRLRRPKVLALMLRFGDAARALGEADLAKAREEVRLVTGAETLPGSRLHVLAIGINGYGPKAKRLRRLTFAEDDARDFATLLVGTQGAAGTGGAKLYSDVMPILLPGANASRTRILQSLDDVARNMSKGDGRDVAVLMFSGHAARIENDFYLFPYGVDATTTSSLEASGMPASQFKDKVDKLAAHGFVLVLLDACQSGAITSDDIQLAPGADGLKNTMARSGVVVLTSSTGAEDSIENPKLGHGAFTALLLKALAGAAAREGHGPISVGELAAYLQAALPEITGGAQHLGVSMDVQRVATNIFIAGESHKTSAPTVRPLEDRQSAGPSRRNRPRTSASAPR